MNFFRVTFIFTQGKGGWSETYYRAFTSGGFPEVVARAQALAGRRISISGHLAKIEYIRVSYLLENPPQTKIVSIAAPSGGTGESDIPQMSVLCRMQGGGTLRRSLILRGLPDVNVVSGAFVNAFQYNLRFNAFRQLLIADGWSFAPYDRAQPLVNFLSASALGVIAFDAPPGWNVYDKVRLFRSRNDAGKTMKGLFKIVATAGNTITLAGWPWGTASLPGLARRIQFVLAPIQELEIIRVVSRKVGRPFGSPVGRRNRH